MSDTKKKIELIATAISFTEFSIIYTVKLSEEYDFMLLPIYANGNIVDKDLIPDRCLLDENKMEVSFKSSNMTPLYLQALLTKKLPSYEENNSDIDNYYAIGDVIGYILRS